MMAGDTGPNGGAGEPRRCWANPVFGVVGKVIAAGTAAHGYPEPRSDARSGPAG